MPGWFVKNVGDATALEHRRGGVWIAFDSREEMFPELGFNIRVLQPGQPAGLYHAESAQEDFLVLAGECLAIIEEQEHVVSTWDFLHCPAGAEHILVGAGDGPCAILMVGARPEGKTRRYPVSGLAARYGASVAQETSSPREAYADWGTNFEPVRVDWPPSSRGSSVDDDGREGRQVRSKATVTETDQLLDDVAGSVLVVD